MNPIQAVDGKYAIVRLLGKGGMGAVYEGRHLGTGRRVAIKVIAGELLQRNSAEGLRRFQREARAAGAIESQHIAQVLDTGIDPSGGVPFIVMEYLEGEDVAKAKERLGTLPVELALRIASQACAGLQRAHATSVVHRDIKPANLYLVRQDGGDIVVKLLDFGIAKITLDRMLSNEDVALTSTGAMLGSPLYMSPEQARGARDVDHRTDIWSLGVVLHECVSGVTPHAACTSLGGLILAICTEQRPILSTAPWVSPEVAEIVDKCLAIDPARRYQSASEMGAAIRRVLRGGHHTIDESMFVQPSASLRAPIHPTESNPRTGPLAGHPASAQAVSARGAVMTSMTQATMARSPGGLERDEGRGGRLATDWDRVARAQPRSRVPITLLSLAGVLVLGAVAFGAYRSHMHRTAAHLAPAVADSSVAIALPAEAPPVSHTVKLAVVPAGALVDVDDAGAAMTDGAVEVTGAIGSTHVVHVKLGQLETTTVVAVTESGAVPPRIELPPAAPPASKSTVAPQAARRATAPPGAAHGATGSFGNPPTVSTVTALPTAPTADRDFK